MKLEHLDIKHTKITQVDITKNPMIGKGKILDLPTTCKKIVFIPEQGDKVDARFCEGYGYRVHISDTKSISQ